MPASTKKPTKSSSGRQLNPDSKSFVPASVAAAPPVTNPAKTPAVVTPSPAPTAPTPVSAPPVWGSKPLDAVRAAPQSNAWRQQNPHQNQNNHKKQSQPQRNQRGRGGNRGGGGAGNSNHGRGGGRHHHHHNNNNNNNNNQYHGSRNVDPASLEFYKPGYGRNAQEKSVQRYTLQDLLGCRLMNLELGEGIGPPPLAAAWKADDRVESISRLSKATPSMGDPSNASKDGSSERRNSTKHGGKSNSKKNLQETAPPLEDCKPLEVNEDTRWKPKTLQKKGQRDAKDEESDDEVLKKALLILNKLSLTKFDKLSDDFVDTGIGINEARLTGCIELIVNKAQSEPHFSSMYAQLCFKLSQTPFPLEEGVEEKKRGKKFKKLLLTRCQEEFEQKTTDKIAQATEGITDPEEKEYHANLIKKNYLGHMRFIGELYKGGLIPLRIMLLCLPALLEGEQKDATEGNGTGDSKGVDEEKVECFAKLMSTIGSSLEQQSEDLKTKAGKPQTSIQLAACWDTVELMAGIKKSPEAPVVSNRIKYMLQDLVEMKNKGWVTRRSQETAKTISEIHKEVAKEEARAARRSSSSGNLVRSSSRGSMGMGDVRKEKAPEVVDKDGFVQIPRRSSSSSSLRRGMSEGSQGFKMTKTSSSSGLKRSQSSTVSFSSFKEERQIPANAEDPLQNPASASTAPRQEAAPAKNFPSPKECGEKTKNLLKEYFLVGDLDDAILSVDEIVGVGHEGSLERGSHAMRDAFLLALECKPDDVTKFLTLLTRCIKEGKIEKETLRLGLNDPLEYLSDIVIDAPLAETHLVSIIAQLLELEVLQFDFLLKAPEFFRDDGEAAKFGGKVLKKMGWLENTAHVEVIEKLMTEEDKSTFPSAKEMLASI